MSALEAHLSVLLRRWRCLEDEILIMNEAEYRVHTEEFPLHRVVAEDIEAAPTRRLRSASAISS